MASSTWRRWPASREPWWSAIGEAVVVEVPQLLEDELRLHARVDEDERRPVLADEVVDRRHRRWRAAVWPAASGSGAPRSPACRMSGRAPPVDRRRGRRACSAAAPSAAAARDSAAARRARARSPRGRSPVRLRRQAWSRARPSASRSPRFEVTSECSSSRITRLQAAEQRPAPRGARAAARAARAWSAGCRAGARSGAARLCGRRVAGAGLDADRQAHLGDRRLEVARDVDGERLQGRDVEGVEARAPLARPRGRGADSSIRRRQEAGQRLAGAGRRDSSTERPARALSSSSS